MTDKTDIAALQRPTRKNHDWSKAVWTDCDHCGEAHTGTVLADDGARICAGCCDAEYYSAWEDLAERAIKLLEAERQRADNANDGWLKVIAERDDLKAAQIPFTPVGVLMKRLPELEAENAELRAKLANPVVLSDCSFEAVSHMAHWYSEGECVAWVAGAEHVKKQILAAGFPVREE